MMAVMAVQLEVLASQVRIYAALRIEVASFV